MRVDRRFRHLGRTRDERGRGEDGDGDDQRLRVLTATLTVSKGTVVTFTNEDSTTHTVTSGANRTKDGKFDTQVSGSNETQITFDTAGTFAYFCSFHSGMVATVVVN